MEIMRLVVTGPVGAGKSTFIRTISEIEVVDTDRRATDETADLKQQTTVAFDFGRLQFGPNAALHLYGTPGQSRFDFMWDILIRKAHAYIVLVAAHRPHEFRYARRILNFMRQRSNAPVVLGFTHMDMENAWSAKNITLALGYVKGVQAPPTVIVNPTESQSTAQAVLTLAQCYLAQNSANQTAEICG
ncbi:ATP/GTP-binding protein [Oscillatoria sp. CS-180]|uniref:GTP-binding protein n=1 Tax=Oscillatoria sp. CS-180 TaxID=3021720 RepID=UPI00232C9DED|nr:ATP/GTP-binding protein [Oscillatoria sp. CS-180]MDB9524920.1 ATP/GTP-binding protein [Oscillatoria sp. CS-180]